MSESTRWRVVRAVEARWLIHSRRHSLLTTLSLSIGVCSRRTPWTRRACQSTALSLSLTHSHTLDTDDTVCSGESCCSEMERSDW